MPEHLLAFTLNHISMTRDHGIKIPAIDLRHALRKAGAVTSTGPVPHHAPLHVTIRIGKRAEQLRENARSGTDTRTTELLIGRVVEEEIGLDERFGGFVVEDDFLVLVGVLVFVVELAVKILIDLGDGLVFAEDMRKWDLFVVLLAAILR